MKRKRKVTISTKKRTGRVEGRERRRAAVRYINTSHRSPPYPAFFNKVHHFLPISISRGGGGWWAVLTIGRTTIGSVNQKKSGMSNEGTDHSDRSRSRSSGSRSRSRYCFSPPPQRFTRVNRKKRLSSSARTKDKKQRWRISHLSPFIRCFSFQLAPPGLKPFALYRPRKLGPRQFPRPQLSRSVCPSLHTPPPNSRFRLRVCGPHLHILRSPTPSNL